MSRRTLALLAANLVALAAVVALVVTWVRDDGEPMPPDTSMDLTVTGTVRADPVMLVADDGTGHLLVGADAEAFRPRAGERLTVAGRVGTPQAGSEDLPVLTVTSSRQADGPAARRLDALLPARVAGTVTVDVPGGLSFRVDGRPVGDGSAGRVRWDTTRVRDGLHVVGLVPADGDAPVRFDTVTVRNGGGPPAELPGREVFRGDFENGSLSQWDVVQAVGPRALRVIREPVRQGRYAARVEVRQGDDPIDSVGDRSELSHVTDETEGQERWYSWSTMLPPDFPSVDAWQVLAQWHADADGPPPLGLYAQGDRMFVQVNRHAGEGRPLSTEFPWEGPVLRGRWRDVVFRIRWSGDDARGEVQMWLDGVEVIPTTRIRTLYPGLANYFKMGYYRNGDIVPTGVVYHDGLVVTQTSP